MWRDSRVQRRGVAGKDGGGGEVLTRGPTPLELFDQNLDLEGDLKMSLLFTSVVRHLLVGEGKGENPN